MEASSRENATFREDAAVSAAAAETSARLSDAREAASEVGRRLEGIRIEHAAELERITARISLAEERHVASEHRALVEIDRERIAVAKMEKALDLERTRARSEVLREQDNRLLPAKTRAAKPSPQGKLRATRRSKAEPTE